MTNSGPPPDAGGPKPAPSPGPLPQLGGEVFRVLAAYVRGQLLIAFILTLVYAPGFALLGVPYWYAMAPLCGFLNLLPVFGTPSGMALTLFATWVSGADLTRILLVAGFYVGVLTLEGYVLTPRIQGRRLGLSPLLVFAAALAGGVLFGFFGVLLAVPTLAILNVVWKYYRGPARA